MEKKADCFQRRFNKAKFGSLFISVALFTASISASNLLFASVVEYPKKAVQIIVQFPPGGTPDLIARLLADKFSKKFGQPFVVKNKPGASGSIATRKVFNAAPDGYTLLLSADSPVVIMPSLYKNLGYSPITALSPVTLVGSTALALMTAPDNAINSVEDLIALAKEKPGKFNYASSGVGSPHHLAGELFQVLAGVNFEHVPYRGFSPGVIDVVSGRVHIIFGSIPSAVKHVQGGKLRAIAVSSSERLPRMPDVPTVMETLPGFELTNWFGLMAPAGTPRAIIDKLNSSTLEILASQEVIEMFSSRGLDIIAQGPEKFAERIQSDIGVWAKIIEAANIQIGK